ncbi:uncharacterized protein LOC108035861 [Drosophila biarmipes]|uniref:uncharacterized protein LOC108035861 n=1 Tax=Drosophila biarmipes TaxID=125945 RepID=UPI0007E6C930|nr:uncharacterized protein LOC108035861 [Drosophila biarmipes]
MASREPCDVVSMEISGAGKPFRHVLRNVYSVSNLSLPMQTLGRRDVQGVHKNARLPMKPYINVVPKLLIGLDHGHLGLPLRTRRFAKEGPYVAATELGWVVFGPVSGQSTTPSPRSCLLAVSMDDTMEQMVEDYFEMESFGVKLVPQVAGSDVARTQRILEDTTVKVGRRYQTGLLWRDDYAVLPRSYDMVHRRLINVERKLKRNGRLALEYDRIIKDYVSKGYARELQQDEDRDPAVYEMNVMTFGATCSPRAAHYVKTVNALKFRDSDPRVVNAIIDQHYVDDYVDSFATESEPISVSTRVKVIHAEAGFELCQFSSTSPIVEAALGPPGQVKSIGWGEAEQKILGMRWKVATDDFRFNMEYHRVPSSVLSGDRVPTKREYLSLPMRTMSIPRLELQAAVLGSRLMNTVKERNTGHQRDGVVDGLKDGAEMDRQHPPPVQAVCWQPSDGDFVVVEGFPVAMGTYS